MPRCSRDVLPDRRPEGDRVANPWWRDAVIYEVYPRSFADANGDGVGDLAGIRARIPYLADLGVDAVWLTPFYTSPQADHGYDVADYRDVDPLFGTLADFDDLVADAHAMGIRVIVDIVPNHTSAEHPWFRKALADGPGSPARERYLFRPGGGRNGGQPPNNWQSVFGGPAWTRVPDGEWYLHLFAPEQPDLNWRHREVGAEFEATLRFWLDHGADGFRVDVAMGMYKDEALPSLTREFTTGPRNQRQRDGHPHWHRPEVHDVYRDWRRILDSYPGDRMGVTEAWAPDPDVLARYVRADQLQQTFNFALQLAPWSAAAFREVIGETSRACAAVGAAPTWVLSSHDAVRHVTRYGDGAIGLARGLAGLLLVLALPGSTYLYQGEELGLSQVDVPDDARQDPMYFRPGSDKGRDGCRVPLPWSGASAPYGFSTDGVAPWLPQPAGWAGRTAADQEADPASVLAFYRTALRVRREHVHGRNERFDWLDLPRGVLGFDRDGLRCVVNFGSRAVRLPAHREVLLTSGPLADGRLPGNTAAWLLT
ncbi:MAG: alpha-amylase [Streptosporangiales bacterium]|nr:alpha-amylase [Streptosporangiales bacterium]